MNQVPRSAPICAASPPCPTPAAATHPADTHRPAPEPSGAHSQLQTHPPNPPPPEKPDQRQTTRHTTRCQSVDGYPALRSSGRPAAPGPFRVPHPAAQRLRRAADLRNSRRRRRPLRRMPALVLRAIWTASSWTSAENLLLVLLVITSSSQEVEHPANRERFAIKLTGDQLGSAAHTIVTV